LKTQRSLLHCLALLTTTILPVAAQASGGEGHEAHGIPVKPLIFAAINFVILVLILGYFLRKPVVEFFSTRAALIGKDINESREMKEAAQQKFADYEARMKGIEKEMQDLVGELKRDGQLERDRLLAIAEEQVVAIKDTSQRIMAQELRRAKEDLKQEAVALAAEMAEELLKKNLTADDQQRIVRQYIHKVEQWS